MPVMNMFPGGSTLQIPLEACTAFSATAGNAQVELTWTDPLDKYATPEGEVSDTGDQLVSEWDHTVLVRKTGSQPAGPNDGTVVVSSSVRNQYQTTAYTDTGLVNDTTYYYGVFAYNKDGVASPGAFTNATPKAGTPLSELTEGTIIKINENGSPVEYYLAKHNYEPDLNGQGRELVVRKNAAINTVWGSTNKWANSNHRAWCNDGFKSRFSAPVQSAMGQTTYEYTEGEGNRTLQTRADAVWELSVYESVPRWQSMYNNYMDKEGEPIPMRSALFPCYNDSGAMVRWSTRSPRYDKTAETDYYVNYYDDDGDAYPSASNPTLNYYSRPCFCLPYTAFVDINLNLDESTLG